MFWFWKFSLEGYKYLMQQYAARGISSSFNFACNSEQMVKGKTAHFWQNTYDVWTTDCMSCYIEEQNINLSPQSTVIFFHPNGKM